MHEKSLFACISVAPVRHHIEVGVSAFNTILSRRWCHYSWGRWFMPHGGRLQLYAEKRNFRMIVGLEGTVCGGLLLFTTGNTARPWDRTSATVLCHLFYQRQYIEVLLLSSIQEALCIPTDTYYRPVGSTCSQGEAKDGYGGTGMAHTVLVCTHSRV